MEEQPVQRSDAFVVRIWREEDPAIWRGWVQHARSGRSAWVRSTGELLAFIERWSGSLDNRSRKGLR